MASKDKDYNWVIIDVQGGEGSGYKDNPSSSGQQNENVGVYTMLG